MKTLHLSIIIFLTAGLLAFTTNSVYAPCLVGVTDCGPPPGVTVSTGTDSQFYEKNDTIDLKGKLYVENYTNPVQVQIVNPTNMTVQTLETFVNNSMFSVKINATFNDSGMYQIITCVKSWCDRSYFKYTAEPYNLSFNGGNYLIWYKSIADLQKIDVDVGAQALRVHISGATAEGLQFVITLPRDLIDFQSARGDQNFTVLVGTQQPDKYMQSASFKEIATNSLSRTLAIDIPYKPISNVQGVWDFKITGSDVLSGPSVFSSPLKQFNSGIAANDVKCGQGLQLVIKAEDGSPACVKPDTANMLIERGWTKIVSQTGLIMPSKTAINELEIDLSNQTYEAGYPVYVNLKNVNHDSGCKIPSISVRNMFDQSLVFGPTPMRNYTDHCIDPWQITFYAGLEKNTLITKSTRYSILATLDNKIYQKEFTVIPSQYSDQNITADSTQIMPGYLTFTSCLPVSDVPNNGTLINYTGFDLYHRYLAGPGTEGIPEIDDYVLKLGHTGSFIMQIHQGQFPEGANLAGGLYFLSENLLNLDNTTVENNGPLASEAHPGLVLRYTPSFAKEGPEGYATVTASISALQNASRGTYWLSLPPGICGGNRALLTIGDRPLAQPPDYVGYDLASHFAQGVGNPTKSDVTFELVNAGIHTFENCSLNSISKNQTSTIKTFDVIPPGMEYKYHANLDSISKVIGSLECKKPSITKVYPDMWVNIIPY